MIVVTLPPFLSYFRNFQYIVSTSGHDYSRALRCPNTLSSDLLKPQSISCSPRATSSEPSYPTAPKKKLKKKVETVGAVRREFAGIPVVRIAAPPTCLRMRACVMKACVFRLKLLCLQ